MRRPPRRARHRQGDRQAPRAPNLPEVAALNQCRCRTPPRSPSCAAACASDGEAGLVGERAAGGGTPGGSTDGPLPPSAATGQCT
eukprot:15265314-Alexandrium_andersonii.AAC.1